MSSLNCFSLNRMFDKKYVIKVREIPYGNLLYFVVQVLD